MILFFILSENKKASCGTIPMLFRKSKDWQSLFRSRQWWFFLRLHHTFSISKIKSLIFRIFPKMARVSPFFTVNEMFCNAVIFILIGIPNIFE
jgi:hypothetical protein